MVFKLPRPALKFRLRTFLLVSFTIALVVARSAAVAPGLFSKWLIGTGRIRYRWFWPQELKTLIDNMPAGEGTEIDNVKAHLCTEFP